MFGGDGKASVVSGSPAANEGIQDKDIITKVGGIDVGTRGDVSSLVAEYAPGETIDLTVLRGGQTMTVKVTLSEYKG